MRELLLVVVVVRFIVGPGLTYTLCGYLTLPPTAAANIRLLHANSRYGGLRDLLFILYFFSIAPLKIFIITILGTSLD